MVHLYFRKSVTLILLFSLVGALLVYPSQVFAATFTVNSTADGVDANPGDGICATSGNQCTLRAAIMETNALGGNNTITLPAGTYGLSLAGAKEDAAATGDLDITAGTVTINGGGRDTTIIDGGKLDRIFDLFSATTVTLRDLTLRNGKGNAADSGNFSQTDGGGAIRAYESNLTLTNILVTQNTSDSNGGGIAFNYAPFAKPALATLTMSNVVVRSNIATTNGGGIIVGGGATLNLSDSTVITNTAKATSSMNLSRVGGGGLYVGQGYTPIGGDFVDTKVNINNANFEDNFTSDKKNGLISGAAWGGAIHLETSTVLIAKTTFKANGAEGKLGGAIYSDGAKLTITNQSSFDGNIVLDEGGAIYAVGVPLLTIDNTTFTNNKAVDSSLGGGGAISASGQLNGGSVSITNSSFQHNATAGSGGALKLGAQTVVYNVDVISNTADANGGGIEILGSVFDAPTQVQNVTISDNVGYVRGGGIDTGGVLFLSNSIVRNNRTQVGDGGGVSSYQSFATVITNTDIINNDAAGNGGGVYDNHGTFGANGDNPHTTLLTDVNLENNHAAGDGGGLYNLVSMKIVRGSISNNTAAISGGGALTYSSFNLNSQRQTYPVQLDLTDVTLNGNGAQDGGAIYQNGGVSTLNNVTMAGNSASSLTKGGGGIYYDNSNPGDELNPNTITVQNTLIAKNSANPGPDCANMLTSAGHNLLGDNTGCTMTAQTGDQIGTGASPINPLLGNLGDNGGATHTMALQTGSPAIDAGNSATCALTDQRTAPRVNTCDIGAFEFGSAPPTPTPTPSPTSPATTTPTPTVTTVAPTATPIPSTTPAGDGKNVFMPFLRR